MPAAILKNSNCNLGLYSQFWLQISEKLLSWLMASVRDCALGQATLLHRDPQINSSFTNNGFALNINNVLCCNRC